MDYSKSGNITETYKLIGKILLELEPYAGLYGYILKRSPSTLKSNLAFVSDEVFRSYLEDLIDFTISDESLYIYRRYFFRTYNLVAILGLLVAMVFGLKLAYSGASFLLAMLAVLSIAVPSGIIWHLAPKIMPNRRLFFARLLNQEINRRNGDSNGERGVMTKINKLVKPSVEGVPGMTTNQTLNSQ